MFFQSNTLLLIGDAVHPQILSSINYINFDNIIIRKYAVIYKGWPLDISFCASANICNCSTLKILHHAVVNNVFKFCHLSHEEFEEWKTKCFNTSFVITVSNTTLHDSTPINITSHNMMPVDLETPSATPQFPVHSQAPAEFAPMQTMFSANSRESTTKQQKICCNKEKKCDPQKNKKGSTHAVMT